MGKSLLTIHKEIEKKNYENSPIGQKEKELRAFYDGLFLKGKKLPEDIAKKVSEHRDAHEQKYKDYIDARLAADREAVDAMLLEAFDKELLILKEYNG